MQGLSESKVVKELQHVAPIWSYGGQPLLHFFLISFNLKLGQYEKEANDIINPKGSTLEIMQKCLNV